MLNVIKGFAYYVKSRIISQQRHHFIPPALLLAKKNQLSTEGWLGCIQGEAYTFWSIACTFTSAKTLKTRPTIVYRDTWANEWHVWLSYSVQFIAVITWTQVGRQTLMDRKDLLRITFITQQTVSLAGAEIFIFFQVCFFSRRSCLPSICQLFWKLQLWFTEKREKKVSLLPIWVKS